MLSITLRQLEYATAVVRHGGMTPAAEALHVSQPALSVAIGQLEALLGAPLFLRRAGGSLSPTAFGRAWLEQAEVQLAGLVRLTSRASATEEIRIAIFEDIAPACVAPILAFAARTAPDLRIIPQVTGFEDLAELLRKGRADMALTWDLGLESNIVRHEMSRIAPRAGFAPEHRLAVKSALTLQDLADEPLILADQGLSIGHMRALFAQKGLVMQIRHRTASLELMRSYAANGLGVSLSYSNPAAGVSHDGKPLLTRPIVDSGTEPLVLAHLAQNPPSAAASRLIALIPAALPESMQ